MVGSVGVMAQASKLSTWEAESGLLSVQDQPALQREHKASLNCTARWYLKNLKPLKKDKRY